MHNNINLPNRTPVSLSSYTDIYIRCADYYYHYYIRLTVFFPGQPG